MQAVSIHPPPTYHIPYPDKQIITKRNLTHIHNHIIIVLALQSYTITSITPNIFLCSKTYHQPSRPSLFSILNYTTSLLIVYPSGASFINVYPLGAIHIFACYGGSADVYPSGATFMNVYPSGAIYIFDCNGREHRCLPIGRNLHNCLPIRRTILYPSGATFINVYPLGAEFFTHRAHKCLPVRRTNVYPLGA